MCVLGGGREGGSDTCTPGHGVSVHLCVSNAVLDNPDLPRADFMQCKFGEY
jgi:hypothetical protein